MTSVHACDVMPIVFQTTCCNILECAFPRAASLCKSMFPTPKKLYLHTPSQIEDSVVPSPLFGRGCIRGFGSGLGTLPLIYPLPNLGLGMTESEIWEGVYQGVLIADFPNLCSHAPHKRPYPLSHS